jgi:cell division protein FtsQ
VARKSSSTAVQEELHLHPGASDYDDGRDRVPFDDARVIGLESEQESPFLRAQKRVSVRRGSLPKKTANSLKWAGVALVVLATLGAAAASVYSYGKHSWRFRIDSSDQIEVEGAQHVSHAQIMEVMGSDIGRNIFFVPLAQRKQQLEQIPWVESASVMRFAPNRLRIEIQERTPIAFARIGSHISLIDAGGNLMELTPGPKHTAATSATGSGWTGSKYSFPVITGLSSGEPLSTRAARMKMYNDLIDQLDSSGAHYSQEISEVDLSDPEDAKVVTADPSGEVLVHLGSANYLQRYRIYVTHVQAWRQQFEKLDSVDLRYDGQIIVNPDLEGITRRPALTPAAAKAALAAGVKNAAIVNYEKYVNHPGPPAASGKLTPQKPKAAAQTIMKASPSTTKTAAKTSPKNATKNATKAASKSPRRTAASPKGKTIIARNSTVVHAAAQHPVQPTSGGTPGSSPSANAATTSIPAKQAATPTSATAGHGNEASPKTASATTPPINASAAPVKTSAATATQMSVRKVVTPALPPVAPVAGSQKKPSAAIPKENPQN